MTSRIVLLELQVFISDKKKRMHKLIETQARVKKAPLGA